MINMPIDNLLYHKFYTIINLITINTYIYKLLNKS